MRPIVQGRKHLEESPNIPALYLLKSFHMLAYTFHLWYLFLLIGIAPSTACNRVIPTQQVLLRYIKL